MRPIWRQRARVPSAPLAVLLGITGFAVSLGATWALVWTMPLRDGTG